MRYMMTNWSAGEKVQTPKSEKLHKTRRFIDTLCEGMKQRL
jgi:hypothetical protein